jgi:hypothetical protein
VDGELLVDGRGGVLAFENIHEGRWVPALSLGPGTEVEVNLGSRPSTLRHLHSGSCQPVAVCNEFKVLWLKWLHSSDPDIAVYV